MPLKMKPESNNRILEENLTPIQREMIKKEEQSNKGYEVDIGEIKIEWKFLVHHDPTKGLDLAYYDKKSGFKSIDIEEMLKGKEITGDIEELIQ